MIYVYWASQPGYKRLKDVKLQHKLWLECVEYKE